MARIQFVDNVNSVCITREMNLPAKIHNPNTIYGEARRAIPEIPGDKECHIMSFSMMRGCVTFQLQRPDGNKMHIIIDRVPTA